MCPNLRLNPRDRGRPASSAAQPSRAKMLSSFIASLNLADHGVRLKIIKWLCQSTEIVNASSPYTSSDLKTLLEVLRRSPQFTIDSTVATSLIAAAVHIEKSAPTDQGLAKYFVQRLSRSHPRNQSLLSKFQHAAVLAIRHCCCMKLLA